ncbi:hypothetical protein HHI36_018795, partial [Cryptolaemus montrouzieri]
EAMKKWLEANTGQNVTECQKPGLMNGSYRRAASVENAQSRLRTTGISSKIVIFLQQKLLL